MHSSWSKQNYSKGIISPINVCTYIHKTCTKHNNKFLMIISMLFLLFFYDCFLWSNSDVYFLWLLYMLFLLFFYDYFYECFLWLWLFLTSTSYGYFLCYFSYVLWLFSYAVSFLYDYLLWLFSYAIYIFITIVIIINISCYFSWLFSHNYVNIQCVS